MNLREQLGRAKRSVRGRRWTIREVDNKLSEVKMIFNPDEYSVQKNAKPMYTDKQLLKILNTQYEASR